MLGNVSIHTKGGRGIQDDSANVVICDIIPYVNIFFFEYVAASVFGYL